MSDKYVSVPVEPTQAMINAGAMVLRDNGADSASDILATDAAFVYEAMIAAAPAPAAQPQEKELDCIEWDSIGKLASVDVIVQGERIKMVPEQPQAQDVRRIPCCCEPGSSCELRNGELECAPSETQPQAQDEREFPSLPVLPAPAGTMQMNWGTPYQKDVDAYTEAQMRGYAIDALLHAALSAPQDAQERDAVTAMCEVAEEHAHGLALELECILADDYNGKWYASALNKLSAYRDAMNAIHERESPTHMGEPVLTTAQPADKPEGKAEQHSDDMNDAVLTEIASVSGKEAEGMLAEMDVLKAEQLSDEQVIAAAYEVDATRAHELGGETMTIFDSDQSLLSFARAIERALLAKGVGKWQPIETAPKDGTTIDLWVGGEFEGRYADCYWGKPMHCCGEAGSYCDSD